MNVKHLYEEGVTFGRLTLIRQIRDSKGRRRWLTRCECGTEIEVLAHQLGSGNATSCGCSRRWEDTGTKRCSMCRETKSSSAFGQNRRRHDGLSTYCLPCKADEQRARNAVNPEKAQAAGRRSRFKVKYGLTVEQVAEMVRVRDGRCDLCSRAAVLHVDHDHESGQVRGLLCGPCNRALGCLGDNLEGVLQAVEYLKRATWDLTELERSVLGGRLH
jgi:hypothetical protein